MGVRLARRRPTTTGSTDTVQISMELEGGYFEVLDYLNRLENMPRLVVVDQVSLSAAEDTADTGGAPSLTASLTGRIFSQANSPAPAAGDIDRIGELSDATTGEASDHPDRGARGH